MANSEVTSDIKSFLCEVTWELLYGIVYRHERFESDEEEIMFFKLGKVFKDRVGYKPMDFFGLGNITGEGWMKFLRKCPGLYFEKGSLSINSDSDIVWRHYNSKRLSENYLGDDKLAEYREMLLVEACDLMVQADGSINVNCANKYGNTPLHFISALPCKHTDDLNLLRWLLNAGASVLNENKEGQNILHIIAGRLRAEEDPEQIICFGRDRVSALCWEYGHRRSVLVFLSQKISSLNLQFLAGKQGWKGNTVLHEWVISTLYLNMYLDTDDSDAQETILISKEIKLASEFIDLWSNLSTMNDYGLTPLHYAFRFEVFKFLVSKGAVPHARSYYGETPFLFILKYLLLPSLFSTECQMEIVSYFSDVDSHECWKACRAGQLMFTTKQLKQFAERRDVLETVSIPDIKAVSPLEIVVLAIRLVVSYPGFGDYIRFQQFLVTGFISEILKQINSNFLTNHNNKGQSLLHVLLDLGESIEDINIFLHRTNSVAHCLTTLLHHGADVNAIDYKGQTALHLSCFQYKKCPSLFGECAQILVRYGARMDLKDSSGRTVQQLLSSNRELQSVCVQTERKVHCISQRHRQRALQIPASSNIVIVGKYRYSHESIINSGAFGCVYVAIKDELEDKTSNIIACRTFALKRLEMARIKPKEITREIDLLLSISTKCENIVDYFETIEEKSFYYLALELMEGDLQWLVEESNMKETMDQEQTLKIQATADIVKGLAFLHQNKFLHRDLKPSNILYTILDINQKPPSLRFKIADFGLAKNFSTQRMFMTTSGASAPGTRCWMAPELVSLESQEHTKESDAFALGMVLHYLLSLGSHPFEDPTVKQPPHQVEANIANMKVFFHKSLTCEAKHFIESILARSPEERSTADTLEQHLFLWSDKKKNEFLIAVGNEEEAANPIKHPNSSLEQCLQNTNVGKEVSVIPWDARVPDVYLDMTTAFKRRGYRTNCIIDLLRFLRNAYSHKQERTPKVIVQLDNNIFLKQFPSLVLDVYVALRDGGFFCRSSINQAVK